MNGGNYPLDQIRSDFPILARRVHGRPLVYFDNAASTQKPRQVVEAIRAFYLEEYANVHRGIHTLAERATERFEAARRKVQDFIGADHPEEIVFLRGTTEAINLVANSLGRLLLGEGDEVLITAMEHHANIVPWQMACQRFGAKLRVAPISASGEVVLEEFERLLSARTKIVAFTHVSNVLGTINPVKAMTEMAHEVGAVVVVDGAQAVPHMRVDVVEIGCDFYAFSAHKMYGPTGVGALYGRLPLLEAMPPFLGGGEMIRKVTFEETLFADPPAKFEAGTPPIAEAVGMAAAIDYLEGIGLERIAAHEKRLLRYARDQLETLPQVRVIGTAPSKSGILSIVVEGIHAHDLGTFLDHYGIAVRAGHHCAMPLMELYGVPATARISFGLYNTFEEIDRLVEALVSIIETFV